jgi:hypothetical protein
MLDFHYKVVLLERSPRGDRKGGRAEMRVVSDSVAAAPEDIWRGARMGRYGDNRVRWLRRSGPRPVLSTGDTDGGSGVPGCEVEPGIMRAALSRGRASAQEIFCT